MEEGPRTHSKTWAKESQWVHVFPQRLKCQSRGSFEYDCSVFPQLPYSNFLGPYASLIQKGFGGRTRRHDLCRQYIFSGETALSPSLTKVLQSPFKKCNWNFPGGPKTKTVFPCSGMGRIPGWRTNIPHAAGMQSKTNKKESVTNS